MIVNGAGKKRTITSEIRKADTFAKHYASVSRHDFTKEERDVNRLAKKILASKSHLCNVSK